MILLCSTDRLDVKGDYSLSSGFIRFRGLLYGTGLISPLNSSRFVDVDGILTNTKDVNIEFSAHDALLE